MAKKTPSINYTSRDYSSIKNDLVAYAKRYYPDTFKDFSQPSFGALMLDSVAYIGDILSFYLDYQANESFLSTAMEYNNVIKLSRTLGYKFQPNPSSFGRLDCYILIPVESSTVAPDKNYMPILKKGSKFVSAANNIFTLLENLDFSKSTNDIVVAQTDSTTGAPTSYAVRTSGQVISGELGVLEVNVGPLEKFKKIRVGNNVSEILSVTDGNGNQYYEVDYLSQNVIYLPTVNRGDNRDTVADILKPVVVSRRFVVEQDAGGTAIQFGYGSDENPVEVKDPSEVILKLHGRDHITDRSFDPSVLNETDKMGVAPSNTSLTIIYRFNSNENVNAPAGTINKVINAKLEFLSAETLAIPKINFVKNSLQVINEEPIVGDVLFPTAEEIKQRAFSSFATQNRAVTKQDYVSMIHRMPSQFGTIKKAAIIQDQDSFNQRNLNIYVISADTSGLLMNTNDTIKKNLKTWITKYKMLNDTVDILNTRICNLGINFVISAFPGAKQI